MNDKKTAEEDLFTEDFGAGEDFNFGEETEVPSGPPPTEGRRGPNKMILIAALGIGVAVILYFAYKYFLAPSNPAQNVEAAKKGTATSTLGTAAQPAGTPKNLATTTEPRKQPLFPTQEESFGANEAAQVLAATGTTPSATEAAQKATGGAATTAAATKPTSAAPNAAPTVGNVGKELPNIFAPTAAATIPTTAPTTTPVTSPTTTPVAATKAAPTQALKPGETAPAQAANPAAATGTTAAITPAGKPEEPHIPPANAQLTPAPSHIPPAQPGPGTAALEQAAAAAKQQPQKLTQIEIDKLNKTVEALSKLNQQMENNLNQVKYLDAYTREISDTVTKLNSQISAMDNRILALTNTANSLSKDVGTVRSEVGTVKRALGDEGLFIEPVAAEGKAAVVLSKDEVLYTNAAPKKCPPGVIIEEPEYSLHAVIPGRAWLKSSSGQIVTVTEGDLVGNYGKILVIDAANGVVLTNSGITFR